jgi:hypothetical protein
MEMPVGAGRLVILTTGWHPHDSQLALSSKFAPLLSSLLEWSGAIVTPPSQFLAGPPISLSHLGFSRESAITVKHPDGTSTSVAAASGLFEGATRPGIYEASSGVLTRAFAVNLDPLESHTVPMAPDELDRLGVPLKVPGTSIKKPDPAGAGPAIETESRQKLWRWIIVTALAVLCIETVLAGLSARRANPGGTPA